MNTHSRTDKYSMYMSVIVLNINNCVAGNGREIGSNKVIKISWNLFEVAIHSFYYCCKYLAFYLSELFVWNFNTMIEANHRLELLCSGFAVHFKKFWNIGFEPCNWTHDLMAYCNLSNTSMLIIKLGNNSNIQTFFPLGIDDKRAVRFTLASNTYMIPIRVFHNVSKLCLQRPSLHGIFKSLERREFGSFLNGIAGKRSD